MNKIKYKSFLYETLTKFSVKYFYTKYESSKYIGE